MRAPILLFLPLCFFRNRDSLRECREAFEVAPTLSMVMVLFVQIG